MIRFRGRVDSILDANSLDEPYIHPQKLLDMIDEMFLSQCRLQEVRWKITFNAKLENELVLENS